MSEQNQRQAEPPTEPRYILLTFISCLSFWYTGSMPLSSRKGCGREFSLGATQPSEYMIHDVIAFLHSLSQYVACAQRRDHQHHAKEGV